MKLSDVVAFMGHQVHVCRNREEGTLLDWMGRELRGRRVLDVAGGDGYWAGRARKRGAEAVSIDLDRRKMEYGRTLAHAPALIVREVRRGPRMGEWYQNPMETWSSWGSGSSSAPSTACFSRCSAIGQVRSAIWTPVTTGSGGLAPLSPGACGGACPVTLVRETRKSIPKSARRTVVT